MSETESAPAPGWYADPEGTGTRWWDGERWTEHRREDGEELAAGVRLATFGQRLGALLVDWVVLFVVMLVVLIPLVVLMVAAGAVDSVVFEVLTGLINLLMFVAIVGVGIGYPILFEGGPDGQTVGKHVMGIRVTEADRRSPIGYGSATVRLLVKSLLSGLFLVGYLWMLWDDENRTWHDMAAETRVIAQGSDARSAPELVRRALRRGRAVIG